MSPTKLQNLTSKQFIELISEYVEIARPHQGIKTRTKRMELAVRSMNLNRLP